MRKEEQKGRFSWNFTGRENARHLCRSAENISIGDSTKMPQ
jgi:hypothetical protein